MFGVTIAFVRIMRATTSVVINILVDSAAACGVGSAILSPRLKVSRRSSQPVQYYRCCKGSPRFTTTAIMPDRHVNAGGELSTTERNQGVISFSPQTFQYHQIGGYVIAESLTTRKGDTAAVRRKLCLYREFSISIRHERE